MEERQLILEINKLLSPDHSDNLFREYNNNIQESIKDGKRVFVFDFHNLESLLYSLQSKNINEESISLTSLTWDEWTNKNIGKHTATLLRAKSPYFGGAIIVLTGRYCCSVQVIKLRQYLDDIKFFKRSKDFCIL